MSQKTCDLDNKRQTFFDNFTPDEEIYFWVGEKTRCISVVMRVP